MRSALVQSLLLCRRARGGHFRSRQQQRLTFSSTSKETSHNKNAQVIKVETSSKQVLESPKPPSPLTEELPLLNPFPLLAHATENVDLASRLRSYSNTFGIIGALMCTLSIQALGSKPIQNHNDGRKRRPILTKYGGIPIAYLEDAYVASWAASFFASAIGLGLSTVVAGIVAATAPAYIKIFVRRHSDVLMALPIAQACSGAFAMLGFTIGLDEARGEPISWIGFIGSTIAGVVVSRSSFGVLKGYKASRASGKLNPPPRPEAPAAGGSGS